MRSTWTHYLLGIAALALGGFFSAPASATVPCDFLTGGGFIITTASNTHPPAKANFGVGGGCKFGQPTWGHLQYIDHGNGLNVHWLTITGYFIEGPITDTKDPKRTGTRLICGTARTNHFGDVDFVVRATDAGEPGRNKDAFDIRLSKNGAIVYTTEGDGPHKLAGGNIQLHKPNPSTTGFFGGNCPAASAA